MSKLVEYLNKIEKDVDQWPSWKKKSLKEALQLSLKAKVKQPHRAITDTDNRSRKLQACT
ncbi:hypothetical protein [Acinetobacter lwoffii]|uniref:hypothetical protein n=1 Tax=Acinetobacter lwoffii TaxID=28090 RepID=UPI003F8DC3F9